MRFEQNGIFLVTWFCAINLGVSKGHLNVNKLLRQNRFIDKPDENFCIICTLQCPNGYIEDTARGCYMCACVTGSRTSPTSTQTPLTLSSTDPLFSLGSSTSIRPRRSTQLTPFSLSHSTPVPPSNSTKPASSFRSSPSTPPNRSTQLISFSLGSSPSIPPSSTTMPSNSTSMPPSLTSIPPSSTSIPSSFTSMSSSSATIPPSSSTQPSFSLVNTTTAPPITTPSSSVTTPTTRASLHRLTDPCLTSQKYCDRNCNGAYVKGPGGCEYCFCSGKYIKDPFSAPTTNVSPGGSAKSSTSTPPVEVCTMAKVICSKKCHPHGYVSRADDCLYCACYKQDFDDDVNDEIDVSKLALANPCIQGLNECHLHCPRGYIKGPRDCDFCTCK